MNVSMAICLSEYASRDSSLIDSHKRNGVVDCLTEEVKECDELLELLKGVDRTGSSLAERIRRDKQAVQEALVVYQ